MLLGTSLHVLVPLHYQSFVGPRPLGLQGSWGSSASPYISRRGASKPLLMMMTHRRAKGAKATDLRKQSQVEYKGLHTKRIRCTVGGVACAATCFFVCSIACDGFCREKIKEENNHEIVGTLGTRWPDLYTNKTQRRRPMPRAALRACCQMWGLHLPTLLANAPSRLFPPAGQACTGLGGGGGMGNTPRWTHKSTWPQQPRQRPKAGAGVGCWVQGTGRGTHK